MWTDILFAAIITIAGIGGLLFLVYVPDRLYFNEKHQLRWRKKP